MGMSLKDDILNAVRDSKIDKAFGFKTPKFRKTTPPPKPSPNLGWQPTKSSGAKPLKPPTSGSNAVKPNPNYVPPISVKSERETCPYELPCGWCTKWDKKCDRKIPESPILKETLTNKICKSDEDHEWVCCGISTKGSHYRCTKCGAYKTVPYTASTSNYYKGE